MAWIPSIAIYIFLSLMLIESTKADCPFPKRILRNGKFVYRRKQDRNLRIAPEQYRLSFKCDENYILDGPTQILCWSNRWTSNIPRCIGISCKDPPFIRNARYEIKPETTSQPVIGSSVEYTCNTGYDLMNVNSYILNCTLSEDKGEWTGELPACERKSKCNDPGVSLDGKKLGNHLFVGSVFRYTCNEGYELHGEETIQCLPGGNWSSTRPLCRPKSVYCNFPSEINHGRITGDKTGDFYLPYDQLEIKCEQGYSYDGESVYNMCEENGEWEEKFSECTKVYCNPPDPIANGTIPEIESLNIANFSYNYEVTYTCNEGYRLIGDSWRICKEKGWSGSTPYCQITQCPDPGVPDHGTRLVDNFNVGTKAIFSCFPGYNLIGSFERYCMANGQWSGALTRCDHENNYCPDPGIPINGVKNSSSYDMGDVVGFQCDPGYHLVGSNGRECLADRTWSGAEAKCRGAYDFDNSEKVSIILDQFIDNKKIDIEKNAKENIGNETGAEGKILDPNFPGRLILYFAFDVSGSVGEHNFRISKEFAKAMVRKIGVSLNGGRAGAVTFSSRAKEEFSPLLYTTTESVLEAFDNIEYTGGGTSASSALSLIYEEMIPLTQGNIEKNGQKSVIFVLTDGKANMGGDPQQQAQLLKNIGVEIYCIGITNSYSEDSLYKIASENEAGSKEEHVFILQNYEVMDWLVQKITNGTIDYSKCGLGLEGMGVQDPGSKIVGGRKSTTSWPWMAGLYFRNLGSDEFEISCGGSIIHKKFILTAAHCLYTRENRLRKYRDIRVELGLIHIENKTSMQAFEVEKFYYHDKYNHPSKIYDYDIALLKLKRPIKFSPLIRPICLPPTEIPTNSSLYQPGQYAVATGWGHSKKLPLNSDDVQMTKNLKEVFIPIQARETCLPAVKQRHPLQPSEKVFTERMVCAGYEKGGNDTCKGDSGGPLMQTQLSSNDIIWTQVGIISFGFGCALERAFGYYTHVQKLLPWVTNFINDPRNQ